ncbi:MAG: protein kinase [Myxococcota bacterium]
MNPFEAGHDGEPPELRPRSVVGAGRFVVRAELGRGGMGTVYRVHDRRAARDVALKVMHRRRDGEHRFAREVRLTARLPRHPGLVQALGAGRLPELCGRPFLCVEWIEGPTLAFRVAMALRVPVPRVVALGLGLADALAVTHAVGVVHRDLTARNILLRSHGADATPVLVDFGLAALVEPDPVGSRITRLHERPGTLTTMAPEQFRGQPPHPAMDVYALGRLLYEMLTGEDPHATVPRSELEARHLAGARVAPLVGAGPRGLRAVVDACLEPDSRSRPAAAEVGARLREVDDALVSQAKVVPLMPLPRAATRGEVLERAAPRRRSWRGLGGGVALVSMLLAGAAATPSVVPPVDERSGLRAGEPRETEAEAVSVAVPQRPPMPERRDESVRPGLATVAASDATTSEREVEAEPLARRPTTVRRTSTARSPIDPRKSPERTTTATSRPPEPSSDSRCRAQRAEATAAARRWAWPRVLRATAERRCWPDPEQRLRLRLTAWIEQRRFDACAREGAEAQAPELVRLVQRCRSRRTPPAGAEP